MAFYFCQARFSNEIGQASKGCRKAMPDYVGGFAKRCVAMNSRLKTLAINRIVQGNFSRQD